MSTRGCIARLQGRAPLEFKGVYHHWDSYPSGLGRALFRLRKREFEGDTEAMLRALIDEHPAGWSTVVGATVRKTPGPQSDNTDGAALCYCHGARNESGWSVTQDNAAEADVDYAYALAGSTMLVLGKAFRSGAEDTFWQVIAEVDLDGAEPNWEVLEDASPATAGVSAQPGSIHEDRLCKKTQPAR